MKLAPWVRFYSLMLLLAWGALAALPAQEQKADEKKEEARAEAAPGAKAAPADVDPLDAEALQYEQMLLPKMWHELDHVRQACDLSREQRPKIKAVALASVKKGAQEYTRQMRQGKDNDPSHVIRKELRKSLESILTKEQWARYQAGADRRAAAHKKATLRIVIAELDSLLYLNAEQRDKIRQALEAKWQDSWESWIQIGQYGGNYFPTIPDEHLTPHLNQQQKTVWQGVQKISPGFGGGERERNDSDWWDGKDAADRPKVEVE